MELCLNYQREAADKNLTIWIHDVPKGSATTIHEKKEEVGTKHLIVGNVEIYIFEEEAA